MVCVCVCDFMSCHVRYIVLFFGFFLPFFFLLYQLLLLRSLLPSYILPSLFFFFHCLRCSDTVQVGEGLRAVLIIFRALPMFLLLFYHFYSVLEYYSFLSPPFLSSPLLLSSALLCSPLLCSLINPTFLGWWTSSSSPSPFITLVLLLLLFSVCLCVGLSYVVGWIGDRVERREGG